MEIPVEKKSSLAWLWILLALLLAALLLWWLLDDDDDVAEPVAVDTVATAPAVVTTDQAVAEDPNRSIAAIKANPSAFVGQSFSRDAVEVASVPTDRGFWIRENGEQIFAMFTQEGESPIDVTDGQTVRISEATLRDTAFLQQGQIPETLDQETRNVVEAQPIFLTLEPGDVEVVERAGSNAATPAQ